MKSHRKQRERYKAARRITHTQFLSFILTKNKHKISHVKSSDKKIDYEPYWNPIRNAIKSSHNEVKPNILLLLDRVIDSDQKYQVNFMKSVNAYCRLIENLDISGEKLKLKDWTKDAKFGHLTVGLRPDLVLLKDGTTTVIKLHINQSKPMNQYAADISIAMMQREFGIQSNTEHIVIDVLQEKVFYQQSDTSFSLVEVEKQALEYVGILDLLSDQDAA